ncbi:response regulator [Yinghuangia seranimata]|uniref:response regulator n=1 Tax=Yinghuangia seranimata TaxID=408067 RepID=UPI00248B57C8|nr:response regulator transcription factor [Yinghuangia seranimata]MDI2125478.1 response regulator transcription factor [Yinghuangia seranimata]
MTDVARVLLCDDQELVRVGLRMIIGSQPDLEVVGEAADGAEAVELARELAPDLVVLDVRMPGLDGIAATERICARDDAPRVLIVTTFDLDSYAYAALRAGAGGFVVKDAPAPELLVAVRGVLRGDAMVAPSVIGRLLEQHLTGLADPRDQARLRMLTDREREVLALVAAGLTNAEIGERLHIGHTTVKTHVGRVLAKLDLRDRIHAVVFAYESGLVRPGG